MLFSSYNFIFFFLLPLLLIWWFVAKKYSCKLSWVLILASIVFYGLSGVHCLTGIKSLVLLSFMLVVNYQFGKLLSISPQKKRISLSKKTVLFCAIVFNFIPLTYLKYGLFISDTLSNLLGINLPISVHGLPLGISFYTFMQVSWLIGIYQGKIELANFPKYFLFSSNFAYIASGPIVRFPQVSSQFDHCKQLSLININTGLVLFVLGLVKKIVIADTLSGYANPVFTAASTGSVLSPIEAWLGSLSYTFQLYFDFSGYTDMALGVALLFGISLPENFNSPYKATSIIDFWRRWHITLSTWFRDFLYIPMGGNRCGRLRQYFNLFITMLLCGVWHGAGWPFLIWGMVHGVMLIINHLFRTLCEQSKVSLSIRENVFIKIFCVMLTFICINFAWVIFRAESLQTVEIMLEAMTGNILADLEILEFFTTQHIDRANAMVAIFICFCICWFFPNSYEFVLGTKEKLSLFSWTPSVFWGIVLALLACTSLLLMQRTTTFLYFAF